MTLRALIFDVDGTLANTERDGHRPAFNAAFSQAGLDWHWDEAFYGTLLAVTGGKERIRHYAKQFDPKTFERPDFDELVQQLHDSKCAIYQRLLSAGAIPLRSAMGQTICNARSEGLRLAIASSSAEQNIICLLRANLGPTADSWFDVITSGEKVAAKKPAPDVYLYALDKLGLPARDCLAIEDSEHGLAAAMEAGIPTVIMVSDYTADEDFEGARMVLSGSQGLTLQRLRMWHDTAGQA